MTSRKSLSHKGVAALKPRAARYAHPDPELRGHYVRVTPSGAKSYAAVARDPKGKQIWATIDFSDKLTLEEARDKAREAIKRIRAGLPAFDVPATRPATCRDVAEGWFKRHVRAKGLRSERELVRQLNVYVYPAWGDRAFLSIRRSDVSALLDELQDERGARQADAVLATVRSIMNWHATRHDAMRRRSREGCDAATQGPRSGRGSSTMTSCARFGARRKPTARSAPSSGSRFSPPNGVTNWPRCGGRT